MAATLSEPAPSSFLPGALLADKYRIDRIVGEGGIGVVLAATHEHLEQRVAVKYLKPAACRQPVLRERFLREARLAAKLTSEHVVRVQDIGTAPCGTPYMVMEFLEGRDLGSRLEGGPMPIPEAVDTVLQACEALAEMHAAGVVHRDLKPENLFLARRPPGPDIVKLLDLGISKVLDKNPESKRQARLTGVTERFGTPQYMPPEQLGASTNVDARADIWAMGVVLHELITGAQPFTGGSVPEICASVLLAPYRGLGDVEAPAGIEGVLRKCLAKKPDERYRNVAEMARALVPFGPASARDRATRVALAIIRGGESVRPSVTAVMPVVQLPRQPLAPTVAAWGDVQAPPSPQPTPRHRGRIAGAVLGAVALLAVTAVQLAPRTPPPSLRLGRALTGAVASAAEEVTLPPAVPDPVPLPPPPKPRARVARPRATGHR